MSGDPWPETTWGASAAPPQIAAVADAPSAPGAPSQSPLAEALAAPLSDTLLWTIATADYGFEADRNRGDLDRLIGGSLAIEDISSGLHECLCLIKWARPRALDHRGGVIADADFHPWRGFACAWLIEGQVTRRPPFLNDDTHDAVAALLENLNALIALGAAPAGGRGASWPALARGVFARLACATPIGAAARDVEVCPDDLPARLLGVIWSVAADPAAPAEARRAAVAAWDAIQTLEAAEADGCAGLEDAGSGAGSLVDAGISGPRWRRLGRWFSERAETAPAAEAPIYAAIGARLQQAVGYGETL